MIQSLNIKRILMKHVSKIGAKEFANVRERRRRITKKRKCVNCLEDCKNMLHSCTCIVNWPGINSAIFAGLFWLECIYLACVLQNINTNMNRNRNYYIKEHIFSRLGWIVYLRVYWYITGLINPTCIFLSYF